MCKLKFGTKFNFANMVNNSFERSLAMDENIKQVLAKPDLPELVRLSLQKTFEKELLSGLDSLYASLGRFDLLTYISDYECEFNPVNVRYECDPSAYNAATRGLDVESANFVLSYIQWRTGEVITHRDWNVTEVWAGLNRLDVVHRHIKAIPV
ncbi:hypothetical protein HYG89_05080 [Acinetobacter sp. SwsAc5]|uniref:hypothetical protein n=1 Tax=Acinetobacter sp. SwsAc5 TaxID=2749438 RepID=UPI0015B8791D|nr:hypothetical protein [Acinetobacter sp. SwsAc5]NWK51940.1 hypothetical protein [Acinetobacter sp. SwsAc5]